MNALVHLPRPKICGRCFAGPSLRRATVFAVQCKCGRRSVGVTAEAALSVWDVEHGVKARDLELRIGLMALIGADYLRGEGDDAAADSAELFGNMLLWGTLGDMMVQTLEKRVSDGRQLRSKLAQIRDRLKKAKEQWRLKHH